LDIRRRRVGKRYTFPRSYINKDNAIEGKQTDIDLLVAFQDKGGFTHLIMLEAKGDTSWDNAQFKHKIDRFVNIFGDNGKRFMNVTPYLGLISPRKPQNLDFNYCPPWLKMGGNIPWFEMGMNDRLKVFGRDREGNPNQKREFWTVNLK